MVGECRFCVVEMKERADKSFLRDGLVDDLGKGGLIELNISIAVIHIKHQLVGAEHTSDTRCALSSPLRSFLVVSVLFPIRPTAARDFCRALAVALGAEGIADAKAIVSLAHFRGSCAWSYSQASFGWSPTIELRVAMKLSSISFIWL